MKKIYLPQCPKCFEAHNNLEVTRLNSALKDYTHFAECPKNNQAIFVKIEKN